MMQQVHKPYNVRIARTPTEKQDAFAVRRTVFIEEQQVPPEIEMDEYDRAEAETVHFVAYLNNLPVGAARFRRYTAAIAKAERVAVVESERGSGLGRQLMHAIEEAARSQGYEQIKLFAQLSASGFYERLGYQQVGETFEQAGIEHIEMIKPLY